MIGLILAQAAQSTVEAAQKTNSNSPESLHVVLSKFFTEGQIVNMSIHLVGAVLLLIGWILARTAILTLISAMALQCMGIAAEIIQIAFAAVIGAISLVLALPFGIGGRDIAAKLLNEFYESLKNDKD